MLKGPLYSLPIDFKLDALTMQKTQTLESKEADGAPQNSRAAHTIEYLNTQVSMNISLF